MTEHCVVQVQAKKETTTNNPLKELSKSKKEIKTMNINNQIKMLNNNRQRAKDTVMVKHHAYKKLNNLYCNKKQQNQVKRRKKHNYVANEF